MAKEKTCNDLATMGTRPCNAFWHDAGTMQARCRHDLSASAGDNESRVSGRRLDLWPSIGPGRLLPGLAAPSPATVRRHMKLTQKDIAALAGVPVATWRSWEQGQVRLDPAVQTLLRVLWREPDAVRRAMVA